MHKNYILDSSTILHDPKCFEKFIDNNVIIPIVVLEELDHIKIRSDATGANARIAIRYIDQIMGENCNFENGIDIGNNTVIFFDKLVRKDDRFNAGGKDDNILACAANYENAVLVTKDVNMRIRAKACGIQAEDYKNDKISVDELYCGYRTINLDNLGIFAEGLTANGLDNCEGTIFEDLYPNEFVQVTSNGFNSIYRKRANGSLRAVKLPPKIWGLQSKNMEQAFALDLLLDPDVPLVTLIGKAGSGKSLIATASALDLVLEQKRYLKAEFYRVIMSVGAELGHLPGPQPLDAKILTPNGWTTMGSIKVGDRVIGRNGKPTKVIGVFPKGKKSVYSVKTTDKVSTECCIDHLWYTETFKDRYETYANIVKGKNRNVGSVKSTKEIIETLYNAKCKPNHYLPRNEIIEFESKELPIPPYTLGAVLGDGSVRDKKVKIYGKDAQIIDRVNFEIKSIGYELHKNGSIGYQFTLLNRDSAGRKVKLTSIETGESVTYNNIEIGAKAIGMGPTGL